MVGEQGKVGRPRSEQARAAVLHAVDDLVVELGYGAVTLKGIAERAGVSRQTVYRWWSTKAEILLEASAIDARQELDVPPHEDPAADLAAYLGALVAFLTTSDAGAAYRALVGEAQHDTAVRDLLRGTDPIGASAAAVIDRALPGDALAVPMPQATALLVGPVFFWILSGREPDALDAGALAADFLRLAAARR
ncbi:MULTISPECIES: TetR/AcrR family transcriptional regulator [unclassified Kitasatospora]|uniref:TetR/AcrR family transcriptional regulator n=1 Tax=unclassified Kitasatospora TaxID=2633591 RepID=UPI000DB9EB0D|nr:TetR/AcrR family transcriptional regulator [Kitasatospora sp. SolWspMP-SS2h]RAJ41878.1 TetR family transcriptional regulator [Kitasatospora sp. SolWspMP-SS2h]